MDENLSKGKILVASEVFTPNGVKTQISDVQHVPVFSTDSFGNVQTNYQDLETSVSVTPTVTRLDAQDPATSTVRLDIEVKVSIESGERRLKDVTAPEYTDKKFQTTRVFPADGKTYLVGTFVSDSDIESLSRVPILGEIPLLKYLFTQKTTNKNRSYALLTLAVKVFPAGPLSDQLRKPWFAKPGGPGEGDTGPRKEQNKDTRPDPAKMLEHQPPLIPEKDIPEEP
jgi:type II secretory pathway component GspD/PulD (secretin)